MIERDHPQKEVNGHLTEFFFLKSKQLVQNQRIFSLLIAIQYVWYLMVYKMHFFPKNVLENCCGPVKGPEERHKHGFT